MRLTLRSILVGLALIGISSSTWAEVTGQINYQKYFQSALVLSTVSAAIAGLGKCDNLHYEEKRKLTTYWRCGSPVNTRTAIVPA